MLKSTFQKKTKTFGFSLLVNALLLLYFLVFFYCAFETDDDYTMKMIVSGVFGAQDSHIIYMNAIIGHLLQFLYRIFPHFPCYEVFHFILIYLSLSLITYVLLNKKQNLFYDLLVYSMLLAAAHFLYVELQFTKTGGIVTLCGHILLCHSLHLNKNRSIAVSVLFLLIGMMIRRNQFLLISFVCATLYIPMLFQILNDLKIRELSIKSKKLLLVIMFCLFCFYGLKYINNLNYSDPAWKYYRSFNSNRGAILDRDHLDYNDDPAFYDSLGLSEIDIKMLYECWNFDDPDVFDLSVMKAIREHQADSKVEILSNIPSLISGSAYFFFKNKGHMFFVFLMLLSLIMYMMSEKNGIGIFSVISTILVMTAAYCFCFFYRNYAILARTHLSIVIAGIFVLLCNIYPTEEEIKRKKLFVSITVIMLFFSLIHFDDIRINSKKAYKDQQKIPAVAEINADTDHIYLRTADEGIDFISGLFVNENVYMKDNLYPLGGWTTYMPLFDDIKVRYGIVNPFKNCINNDKVYLLISSEEKMNMIVEYIQKHYNENVRLEMVKTIEANKIYGVYRVVSQ